MNPVRSVGSGDSRPAAESADIKRPNELVLTGLVTAPTSPYSTHSTIQGFMKVKLGSTLPGYLFNSGNPN